MSSITRKDDDMYWRGDRDSLQLREKIKDRTLIEVGHVIDAFLHAPAQICAEHHILRRFAGDISKPRFTTEALIECIAHIEDKDQSFIETYVAELIKRAKHDPGVIRSVRERVRTNSPLLQAMLDELESFCRSDWRHLSAHDLQAAFYILRIAHLTESEILDKVDVSTTDGRWMLSIYRSYTENKVALQGWNPRIGFGELAKPVTSFDLRLEQLLARFERSSSN